MTKALVVAIGSALAGAGLFAAGCSAEPARTTTTVEMRGFAFAPAAVSVHVGDTIAWLNGDALPHTATAADSTWDSGELAAGESWAYVAERAGTIDYLCAYHPSMRGRIDISD